MIHKLIDIDKDGLLPKKKEMIGNKIALSFESGYNSSNKDHQNLGIEIVVEELAKELCKFYGIDDWDEMTFSKQGWIDIAKAIANNPKIIKLVRIK